MTQILIPREPSPALLRPFIGCNTQELHEAWAAMIRIAEVQHARAGGQGVQQIEEPPQSVDIAINHGTEDLAMHSLSTAPAAVAGSADDLAELAMLNKLVELGTQAYGALAKSNSDDGPSGTAAYVRWQERRAEMGELIRAHKAPALEAPSAYNSAGPIKRYMLDCNIDGMDQFREFILATDHDTLVHDVLANADPAGMVQENGLLRDQVRQLDAMVGRMKREAAAPQAPAAPEDPMDWPLPCDVTVGHGTIRKGCKLRTLVLRMQVLYQLAQETELAAPAAPAVNALAPVQALLDVHAALLDANPYAYFELAYTRQTGWMAWITDKPMYGAQLINPDRKVLARGQGDTAAAACAAAAQAKEGGAA